MTGGADLVARLASHGLRSATETRYALDADEAADAITAAARANLLGLLGCLVAEGVVRAPPVVASRIRDAALGRLVSDMRIERRCGVVVERLRSEGIPVRVLKGLATAHLDHPEASHRSTTDVDLLVPGRDVATVVALLGDLGYERDLPERRPGFDRRFAKEVTLFGPGASPEIDLHRTLVAGPFGLALDPAEVFGEGQSLVLAGSVEAVALSLPWRLLHSCLVVGAGDLAPSLGLMRDLALQAQDPELDIGHFRALVARSRAGPVVAAALRRTRARIGIDLPGLLGHDDDAPAWWLRTYAGHGGNDVTAQVGAVVALRWRDRLPYLVALAAPSRHYRRARSAAGRTSASQLLLDALPPSFRWRGGRRTTSR